MNVSNQKRRLAQFITPESIASLMAKWCLRGGKNKSILDPAVGPGTFFRAILRIDPSTRFSSKFVGFDLDENMLNICSSSFAQDLFFKLDLRKANFLLDDSNDLFDVIICNPPYLKFQDYEPKDQVIAKLQSHYRTKLSGFTNIYALFILKSLARLSNQGKAAFIVPSEFMNSDYGKAVKKLLLASGILKYVIVFDSKISLFEDALTTSSILLFEDSKERQEVEFINIENVEKINEVEKHLLTTDSRKPIGKKFEYSELEPNKKWRNYYYTEVKKYFPNTVPLRTYAKVTRGIATGANAFFIFSESKRKRYSIDPKFLIPCISKSMHAPGFFFTDSDFQTLKNLDKPVYLLNAYDSSDENTQKYIRQGEDQGLHLRFLTKMRKPWYSIEKRPPAPILATVFNRNGVRFVRNIAEVSNLTTFHCIYINRDESKFSKLLMTFFLSSLSHKLLLDSTREYGNGLRKLEPNDFNNSPVPDYDSFSSRELQYLIEIYEECRLIHGTQKLFTKIIEELDDFYQRKLSKL